MIPPASAAAVLSRAMVLLAAGPSDEALALLADATSRFPDDAALANRHADALHLGGRLGEAAAEYRRALRLDEGAAEAWYGLGSAELTRAAYGEAVRCLTRAVVLRPERPDIRFKLGEAQFELGEVDAALVSFRVAATAEDLALRQRALGNIALIIPGAPSADNASILAARRRWAAAVAPAGSPVPVPSPPVSDGKLRIGYVSSFFAARNWMKPVWGVINHHDRSRFEIHLFATGEGPSAESGYRDHDSDYIHQISRSSNEAVAGYVAAAGIDILVDLNGYSAQRRLPLFMHRPAPTIVAWFGMYATTGIAAFDYVIADEAALPPEEEHFCSERVLRVPPSYLSFSVPYPVPEVAPPPSLAAGRLTFGCLCSQHKLTGPVIDAWAEILRGAPDCALLLRNALLGEASNRAALVERFARRGIDPARLRLEGPAEHGAFLATYDRIDVALDTYPYNGGTTTMEALWQGVPVLSFDGDRWASRTSRSLLVAAGLDEWCSDRAAYVDRAIALARSPETPATLAALRAGMRTRLAGSAACDTAGLCRALERHYIEMAGAAGS